jgi:hypothetical protein
MHEDHISPNYTSWIADKYSTAMRLYNKGELDSALTIIEELFQECPYDFDYHEFYWVGDDSNRGWISRFSPISFDNYTITRAKVAEFIEMIPRRKQEMELERLEFERKKEEIAFIRQRWAKELQMSPSDIAALQTETLKLEVEKLQAGNIEKQLLMK